MSIFPKHKFSWRKTGLQARFELTIDIKFGSRTETCILVYNSSNLVSASTIILVAEQDLRLSHVT